MRETNATNCIATTDAGGTPYGVRLKRARESAGRSVEQVAALLGLAPRDYDEWEAYEGELNMATSLRDLRRIADAVGIRTSQIFDDAPARGFSVNPQELSRRIRTHFDANGMSTEEFEHRVGFGIAPVLEDTSTVLDWNLDCLRYVCNELGVDWRLALP